MHFFLTLSIALLSLPSLFGVPTKPVKTTQIDLTTSEFRIYSQNGEDGVIDAIFKAIGTTSKYYVEFGTQNGAECNTRYLKELGWNGLLMDGDFEIPEINLHREFITAENINDLFEKYHVPADLDLLSIDIDFNDFYVWHAISETYKPRVVVIEYNSTHLPDEDKIVIYDAKGMWDRTNYFGASILALYHLGRLKGYSLVYAENMGVNLFFVRDDVLNKLAASGVQFKNVGDVNALYRFPGYHAGGPNGGHPQDPRNRPYISSREFFQSLKSKAPGT